MSNYDEINDDDLIPSRRLREEDFALDPKNKPTVDRFIQALVLGYSELDTFCRLFGGQYRNDKYILDRLDSIKENPYVRRSVEAGIANLSLEKEWTPQVSIYEALKLLRSPFTKCTTRRDVMNQLNVLAGLTFIDKDGNTRKGKDLMDFYSNAERLKQQLPAPPEAGPTADPIE
ncbi:hypothetical protein [Burkholderia phage BCSR52]|uniref:Uncharacterized protein n=1 Tax=Burkholderia phage BCSR52 TaxID=2805748 RepID=A0A889IQD8_9CAUD|nr:hypothetical protein [Burkholderia phage BCSR52]